MRIALDNCVDRRLARLLRDHETRHASELGWQTLQNGQLLAAAAAGGFHVFITVDQNIRFQQRLVDLPLPVLEINVRDTRFKAISALAPHLPGALALTARFHFVSLTADGMTETLAPRTG
ncbi:MAG: hypothetical protein ACKVS8_01135 [Phycisphaerales bacterium]